MLMSIGPRKPQTLPQPEPAAPAPPETIEEQADRAGRAQRALSILNDEVFIDAIDVVEKRYVQDILSAEDHSGVLEASLQLRALRDIVAAMHALVADHPDYDAITYE